MNGLKMFEDLGSVAIATGTPILFAALGEIIAEKSGVQNLGIEGMMYMGAITAFLTGLALQASGMATFASMLIIIVLAAVVGSLMALLHAYVCLSLKANQIISGLALTIFGTGLSYYLGTTLITDATSILNGRLVGASVATNLNIPVVGEVLRMILNQDFLVYLGYILVILSWIFIYKTNKGVSLRAIGENPGAADALGVNVKRSRYLYVMVGGAMAGIAGASLIISQSSAGKWGQEMVAGRGWIAIALVIFARWNPKIVIVGAYLFGLALALESRAQVYGWYADIRILKMLPYVATLLALIIPFIFSKRKEVGEPEALGKPYDREER